GELQAAKRHIEQKNRAMMSTSTTSLIISPLIGEDGQSCDLSLAPNPKSQILLKPLVRQSF
ncbi:MAG: hypothetical protein PHO60_07065, partial [Methanothrix sp.]|nr:hypothetical protein [Methanothrix sp.]